jgi:hypothetical protein
VLVMMSVTVTVSMMVMPRVPALLLLLFFLHSPQTYAMQTIVRVKSVHFLDFVELNPLFILVQVRVSEVLERAIIAVADSILRLVRFEFVQTGSLDADQVADVEAGLGLFRHGRGVVAGGRLGDQVLEFGDGGACRQEQIHDLVVFVGE